MGTQPTMSVQNSSHAKNVLEFEKPIAKMEQEIQRLEATQVESGRDYSDIIKGIREQLSAALKEAYANLTPWENVLVARHPRRPLMRDYIRTICKDFCELHGDRLCANDKAIVCGFARLAGQRVMLVGHHKGRDTREKIESNFGCAHPDGYRKALRAMRLAEKFGVPVVSLIDTPGAYPGVQAEEARDRQCDRGQPDGNVALADAGGRLRYRRRRERRRARFGRCGPGGGNGARVLLRDQPRGLRGDPLEIRPGSAACGRRAPPYPEASDGIRLD